MKTTQTETNYVQRSSAENIHDESLNWLSELLFVKDEQLFFDDLIKSYTLQLINSKHFNKSKKIIEKLVNVQKETKALIETVKAHESNLEIIVKKADQSDEEDNYKNEHEELIILVSEFFETYKSLKKQLFKIIKSIIKESKQKQLLEKF